MYEDINSYFLFICDYVADRQTQSLFDQKYTVTVLGHLVSILHSFLHNMP